MTLDDYAIQFGTDKASTHHNYTKIYEAVFSPIRSEVRGLIEIGIGGKRYKGISGGSLRMWAAYFAGAQVVGVDLDPVTDTDFGERISVVIGDQTRRSVLDRALKLLPSIDIIIDDGSHRNRLTIATFEYLFPRLNPGGHYVIEDTNSGSDLRLGNLRSQLEELVLQLLRDIETNGRILSKANSADFDKISTDYVLNEYERWVESVTLYRGVYIVKKRAS